MNHLVTALPRSIQGGFIAHVGDVSAAEARCLTGEEIHVNAVVHLDGTQVHIKNRSALGQVWHVHVDLTIKAPGAHQSLVQDVRPVGRSQDDDSAVCAESVHLSEELIQCVFAFVIGPHTRVFPARPADGIDFVDKDDCRSFLLRLLEQIAHP